MDKTISDQVSSNQVVQAGIIGTGHFSTAIVSQSVSIPQLHIPAVADVDPKAGVRAFAEANIPAEEVAICDSSRSVKQAWDQRKRIVTPDASLLMDLPIDIMVESTGIPEVGARYGLETIKNGKHLAMVSKDVDIVVGPLLKHLADKAGVIYTQVDGDQHGLLVQLVTWARQLGLEIISAGKFLEFDLVLDTDHSNVSWGSNSISLSPEKAGLFFPQTNQDLASILAARRKALGSLGAHKGYDVVEMALAANVVDLHPDTPALHGAVLRTNEIADVYCDQERGGILKSTGIVDCVSALRFPYESAMGGGVFAVVDASSDYSRKIMHTKGVPPNTRGNAGLIHMPYHLCGVETATTLLKAVLQNEPTSGKNLRPNYDVFSNARVDLPMGEELPGDKSPDLKAWVGPAKTRSESNPIPLHLARGNRLRRDLPSGQQITYSDVQEPEDSLLWKLRKQQDQMFLKPA